jgi:hypothetical protein
MAVSSVPTAESGGDVEVFEWTKAEYRRALKAALDEIGITYRQLVAQARRDQFVSLRARQLWLTVKHNGSGW